jgi:hypothetical protein
MLPKEVIIHMAGGFLYIIINKNFPGWVKVGTTRNLKKRLSTYQTASPYRDYEIIYSIEHPEYRVAESKIRETMVHFAKSIRNEWYEVDLDMAKSRLDEQLDIYLEYGGSLS